MSQARGEASSFELEVEPESDSYDSSDERWRDQVAALYGDLRAGGIPMREERTSVPGAKGDVSTIIMALGSAGAFQATVTILRTWLARDKKRRVKVRWKEDEGTREVTVTADSDTATLERIAQEAIKQSSEK